MTPLFCSKFFLHFLIFLGLITISHNSYSQESIGVCEFDYNDNSIVSFYRSIGSEILYKLRFTEGSDDIIPYTRERYSELDWLYPEYGRVFDGDGFVTLFVLRCKSIKGDWIELYTDKNGKDTYWIIKSEITKLKTWEEYLENMLIIELKDPETIIYSTKSTCSERIKYSGSNCFKASEVDGEWMKIIPYTSCSTDLKLADKAIGWIRWKNNCDVRVKYDPW